MCVFCGLEAAVEWYNVPVARTQNFFIKPSIGPLAEGHTLLITKGHLTSMARLPKNQLPEFREAKTQMGLAVGRLFGKAVFFEHGDNGQNTSRPACCIDHAHLHCMPLDFDLVGMVKRDYPNCRELTDIAELEEMKDKNYLYIEDQEGRMFAVDTPNLPRQYLRKVISTELGHQAAWDFWVFPDHETARKTQAKLKGHDWRFGEYE